MREACDCGKAVCFKTPILCLLYLFEVGIVSCFKLSTLQNSPMVEILFNQWPVDEQEIRLWE